MIDYEMIQKVMKIVDYVGSGLQIILGIAKFFNIIFKPSSVDYIVNIYLIGLGVMFILVEIPSTALAIVTKQFHFIESSIGKACFCVFLGLLCFNEEWFTIVVAVIWWVIAVAHLVIGIIFYDKEQSAASSAPATKPEQKQAVEIAVTPTKPVD